MGGIADAARAHRAAFEQEEVKAILLRDTKADVGGVSVEGREGDTASMPRWAAHRLEADGGCQVQDEDMVVALKQALVKENATNEFAMAKLDPLFYIRLRAHILRLPEADRGRVRGMLNTLFRNRHGKLARLADSSKLTSQLSERMTVEERAFHEEVRRSSEELTRAVMGGPE